MNGMFKGSTLLGADKYVPEFKYELVDLSELTDPEIKGGIELRSVLLALKYIKSDEIITKTIEIINLLKSLPEDKKGIKYLMSTVTYILNATNEETRKKLEAIIRRETNQEIKICQD